MAISQSIVGATQAYRDAMQTTSTAQSSQTRDVLANDPVQDFSSVLRDGIQNAVETQRTGEAMSMRAVANEADIAEVVAAVSNAEMTLQTVVSIRDKVIQAYQEIMRMPI